MEQTNQDHQGSETPNVLAQIQNLAIIPDDLQD
jgi:hypothetical protein